MHTIINNQSNEDSRFYTFQHDTHIARLTRFF